MKHYTYTSLFFLVATVLQADPSALPSRVEVAQKDVTQSGWTLGISPRTQPTLGRDQEVSLLDEVKPFYVSATSTPEFTTNAFFDDTKKSDWLFQQAAEAGAETIIADRYYVHADVGASLVRYDKFASLNRDSLDVRVDTSYLLSNTSSVGLAYIGSWYTEREFDKIAPTFHSLLLNATYARPLLSGNSFQMTTVLTRIWSSPADFDLTSISLTSSVVRPLGNKVFFGLSGRIEYTWFDHYFESVFNERRRDLVLSAGAYLAYHPCKNAELRLDLMFTNNDSTLKTTDFATGHQVRPFDYNVLSFVPMVKFIVNF